MLREIALFLLLQTALSGQLVSDESLRLDALNAIFPRMPASHLLPDANDEPVYAIEGRFTNPAEECASVDINIEDHADTREARLKLFRWPGRPGEFAALVQYRFLDADPSLACPSIALLVHIVQGDSWRATGRYLFETMHHFSIRSAEIPSFAPQPSPLMMIESDEGRAGAGLVTMHVFDLSRGEFDEILRTNTWMAREADERYTQTLDLSRTARARGQSFCFTKKLELFGGVAFNPPKITTPCYGRGHLEPPAASTATPDAPN